MRLFALGTSVAACLTCATAQAGCLKANESDQIAEGRLTSVRITIEAYRLKEQAFILQLAADACLEGPDEFDKVEATRRIHVFSMDDACAASCAPLSARPSASAAMHLANTPHIITRRS